MKRNLAILLSLLTFCSAPCIVHAEGELTVEQKQAFIFDNKDSGYFFAKIKNTGDAPIALDKATLAIFSENDELLSSDNYITTYPSSMLIQPDEYTYVSEFLWDSTLENATIGDIKLSLQTNTNGYAISKIPCEASLSLKEDNEYSNYIYITFTNESAETNYEYVVSASLLDADGNICFSKSECLDTLGVAPNSTVTYKMYVDYDFIEYYNAHQIVPSSIDATVFLMEE